MDADDYDASRVEYLAAKRDAALQASLYAPEPQPQPEQWPQEGVELSDLHQRIYEAHDFIQHSEVTPGTNAAEKVLAAVKELARVVKQLQAHKQT